MAAPFVRGAAAPMCDKASSHRHETASSRRGCRWNGRTGTLLTSLPQEDVASETPFQTNPCLCKLLRSTLWDNQETKTVSGRHHPAISGHSERGSFIFGHTQKPNEQNIRHGLARRVLPAPNEHINLESFSIGR